MSHRSGPVRSERSESLCSQRSVDSQNNYNNQHTQNNQNNPGSQSNSSNYTWKPKRGDQNNQNQNNKGNQNDQSNQNDKSNESNYTWKVSQNNESSQDTYPWNHKNKCNTYNNQSNENNYNNQNNRDNYNNQNNRNNSQNQSNFNNTNQTNQNSYVGNNQNNPNAYNRSNQNNYNSQNSCNNQSSNNQTGGSGANQPPVYCVITPQPLIISSEQQPNLSKLTEKPMYLYSTNNPQQNNSNPKSNIYSPIPNIQYPLNPLLSNSASNLTECPQNDSETRLNLSQTDTRLNLSQTDTRLNLSQTDTRLNLSQTDTRLNLSQTDTRLNLSQTDTRLNLSQTDTTSNLSQTDTRSNFSQDDKDFNVTCNVDNSDEDNKKERLRRRRSSRPWRGYVVEEEEKEKCFQSVAVNNHYIKEAISDGDTAVSISSASEKLFHLHMKFAAHRRFVDDGRSVDSREVVDPAIPFNESAEKPGECECEEEQKKAGIHHHSFPKEAIPRCEEYSNNANLLHHYRLIITPETNFVTRDPTTIYYDGKDFCFEGYSIFTHVRIDEIPAYTFTRNFIDYTVRFIKVDYIPEGFCIKDLDIVSDYFFNDIMELFDWKRTSTEKNCCRRFHFMPRFVHRTQDLTSEQAKEISEILSMGEIITYLIDSCTPFTEKDVIKTFTHDDWKDFAKEKHGTLISNMRNKPRTIRVDDVSHIGMIPHGAKKYPDVVHLTPKFKEGTKLDLKEYGNLCVKLTKAKRAVKSRAVPRKEDQKLVWSLAEEIQKRKEIKGATKWVDISFTSRKYVNTGLRWDVCQHASYLPALTNYLRFMLCTSIFERNMNYKFKDKSLLKVALTHPSHIDTASYSTFIWNMLQNVGKQYPHVEKRFRKIPPIAGKKKGVIYMTHLMANLFQQDEIRSACRHNERLEFLGDAILDYLTSLHLFLMFPEKGPGKLTAFRSGIVQTENLSDLAKKIGLEQYILVQHRVAELNKSESYLGNALEAVVGAVYLDGGLCAVDNLLSFLLFIDDTHLCKVWNNLKKHPLQEEHPETDRHLIEKTDILKKFVHLEDQIGVEFKHIRILARAFTQSVHGLYDPKVTGGNYERLEFLGDAILKYVSSDYLYRHFPRHQEGHLTLLRSSLVNSRCLAQAARELGLNNYIIFQSYRESCHMKEKVCSDVFEALLGALHIEKGVEKGILYCNKLVEVCILSRLKEFIINQEWLDPKSQLQQCCHSLRDPANPLKEGKEYFHPVYKRLKYMADGGVFYFKVGVYVNGKKLGIGEGRSTKEAEKEAAKQALCNNYFEQYAQQKRIIIRKFGRADNKSDDSASDEGELERPRRVRQYSSYDDDDDDDDSDADGEKETEVEEVGEEEGDETTSEKKKKEAVSNKEKVVSSKTKRDGRSRRSASKNRDRNSSSHKSRHRSSELRSSRRRVQSPSKSPRYSRFRSDRETSRKRTESPRKRSREREQPTTPSSSSSKRTKTSDDTRRSQSRKVEQRSSKDRRKKPQMEISLDRWILENKSTDDCNNKSKSSACTLVPLPHLDLETVSSSDNGEDALETITSSENSEEFEVYEVISSSDFESDSGNERRMKRKVPEAMDFKVEENETEILSEAMEKELEDINSAEEASQKGATTEEEEVDDVDIGDIDDSHLGDDESEEAQSVQSLSSDSERSEVSEDEYEDVDVWEAGSDAGSASESDLASERGEPSGENNAPQDSDVVSTASDAVFLEIEDISPESETRVIDVGLQSITSPLSSVTSVESEKALEQISDGSLSEVDVY